MRHATRLLPILLALSGLACRDANVGGDPIVIGVALPEHEDGADLLHGAQMAVDEVNGSGGALGRRFALAVEASPSPDLGKQHERTTADTGRRQALSLIGQHPLAVIGHGTPDGAAAAAPLYQARDILFLSTFETDETLAAEGLDRVLLLTLPSEFLYRSLARYAYEQGWCRIAIVKERSNVGIEHPLFFEKFAQAHGLSIVSTYSFPPQTENFMPLVLAGLNDPHVGLGTVDAVLFVGTSNDAGAFLRDARHLGVDIPVLAPWFSVGPSAFRVAGPAIKNTVSHTVFDQRTPSSALVAFQTEFLKKFGAAAGTSAMLGYDSVHILAHVIKQAGTLTPGVLASHLRGLRHTGAYPGLNGPIAFDAGGNRVCATVNIVNLAPGGFEYAATMADTDVVKGAVNLLPPPLCRTP